MSTKEKLSFKKTGHAKSATDGQGWKSTEVNDTLNSFDNAETRTPTLILQKVYENHSQDTRYRDMGEVCQPISATFGMGGNNQPFVVKQVFDASRRHDYEQFKDDVCETVQAHYGTGGGNVPLVMEGFDNYNISLTGDVAKTLQSQGGGSGVNEGCVLGVKILNPNDSQGNQIADEKSGVYPTLRGSGGAGYQQGYLNNYVKSVDTSHADDVARVDDVVPCMQGRQSQGGNNVMAESIVRRLTPLECERLQGYPDNWTDIGEWIDSKGKKHKDADSPRYKALGNSIALPFWEWMAHRMVAQYDRPTTMASLFDGIGGFPLVFSRCGTTPVWASEIEEFPIAVTKRRFPDLEDENHDEHNIDK